MRRILDALYDSAAALAALLMVGLLIMVLLSVLGRQFNFHVRGTDAYAGYLMAGAGFLSLAHTLKRGEHIRVTLLLSKLTGGAKQGLEIWSLAAASALSGLFAWYSVKLTVGSYQFNDISTGNDATPLWIPQLTMAAGAIILLIAFIDDLVMEVRGQRVVPVSDEPLRNE
jgi:TRAP-type C4-dicarboxylate transport system permease small subunit